MAVSPITGHITLTRMLSEASSTANDFVSKFAAPFEALYQVKPGLGRIPAVEPVLMMQPDFFKRIMGTTALIMW